MPSDKTRRQEATETGAMPRIETEPLLHRDPPPPPPPEIIDDTKGAKTGEMPIVSDTAEDNNLRDEDTPKGNKG
jgi:hypothetical protein